MLPKLALALVLTGLPLAAFSQTDGGTLAERTPLTVSIDDHLPMRKGQAIRARLMYAVYDRDKLVLAKGTVVGGTVVELQSNRSRRIKAALGGDFTPFHKPVVQFTEIVLADGSKLPLSTEVATDGAPIYRAVAPPPAKGGFLRQQFDGFVTVARNDVATFTAPGKGDRFVQFIYGQLPYHPQRIEKGTAWTIETKAPIAVPAESAEALAADPPVVAVARHFWEPAPAPAAAEHEDNGAWMIEAYLDHAMSSESSSTGQAIRATVAQPIYNADHTVAVPQGATLIGAVTRAKPARRFGRTGVLSFSFRQLEIPDEATQSVETRLTGTDSAAQIALNSEGQAKSAPKDKISLPIILALMASRPMDQDHHGAGEGAAGKNATGGAAGLGLVGTVVGLAGGSPNVAAGIGYWGAARAFYERWIARGQKIEFAKDTRVVVETTARRSAPIKPAQ